MRSAGLCRIFFLSLRSLQRAAPFERSDPAGDQRESWRTGCRCFGVSRFSDRPVAAAGPRGLSCRPRCCWNAHASVKFTKAFAALDDTQADALLAPLLEPWTWQEPTEPVALFLRHAKSDIR